MRNPILKIAIPSIVSNITVPLLALVDTTIVGHFGADARLTEAPAEQPGAAVYLGAIAVGGMLFNMIYWLFSFLRRGRRIYGPSMRLSTVQSRSERRSCWRSTPILSPMLSAMSCWRALGAPWRTWDWSSR